MPKLFDNLWVKIAALLLAFLLWLHVATEKVYQNQITLPIAQVELPGGLVLVEPPPESVLVSVTAIGKALLRSDWKRSGARLVITGARPGRFKQEIGTENLSLVEPQRVNLVEVAAPREYFFNCDRLIEKAVPVRSRVVIEPDDGFAIGNADSIIPAAVTIAGPRGSLNGVESIETISEHLEGVRNNFELKVALAHPDIYNLTITPDSVKLYVNLVPLKTREFAGVALRLKNLPFRQTVNFTPRSVDILVRGPMEVVDGMSSFGIEATADYRLLGIDSLIPVELSLPPSVILVRSSVDSVRIIK
ncbi:MAG: YbbR-like domain-containing protein [Candidatus Zixiibacteriota bacterium]|nr:MAG: YbbR-like domain-containing protein [candidate division Zixibacteria bacterium]